MPRQSAVTLFGEWARLGKDEGMESGHSPSVEEMISAVIGRTPEKFAAIDIGCGNGWAVRRLASLPGCHRSSGVDGSEQMVKKARSIDPEGEYFVGDLPGWRPKESVDLILSMEFIYYLDEPLKFFGILHDDWLSSGGSVVFGLDHYLVARQTRDPHGHAIDGRVARWIGDCWIQGCRDSTSMPKDRLARNARLDRH